MMRGRTLVALATAVAVLAVPAHADAALRWRNCEEDGHQCARLTVPLDRSGAVPGSVSLHLVRAPFQRAPAAGGRDPAVRG